MTEQLNAAIRGQIYFWVINQRQSRKTQPFSWCFFFSCVTELAVARTPPRFFWWFVANVAQNLATITRQKVGGWEQTPDFEAPVPIQTERILFDINFFLQREPSVLKITELIFGFFILQFKSPYWILQFSNLLNQSETEETLPLPQNRCRENDQECKRRSQMLHQKRPFHITNSGIFSRGSSCNVATRLSQAWLA